MFISSPKSATLPAVDTGQGGGSHRPALMPVSVQRKENAMSIDRAVLAFAGTMILLSVVLGTFVSPYWYLFTVFIGLNMLQSAFTGFCPAAIAAKKLGLKPGNAFD